jgi:hypothetical protein
MAWIDPIALVLVTAIAVSLLRGGRISNLAEVRLRVWWMLFVGLGMQIVAANLPGRAGEANPYAVGLILASYLPLIAVVVINREEAGMWIAAIGILMNFTVIAANQGMPVSPEAAHLAGAGSGSLELGAKHVVLDEGSTFPFLADIIPLPLLRQVISLGDVFLAVGLGQFLEAQLRKPIHWFRHGGSGQPGSAVKR